MRQAIKYYVVFILLTISLVVSILFFYYRVYRHDFSHLKQQVAFSLGLVSEKVSQDISDDISVISDALADLAGMLLVDEIEVNDSREQLESSFNRLKEFYIGNIELLHANGVRITSVSMPGWKNPPVSFRSYFQFFQNRITDKPILRIIAGHRKTSGKVILILMPVYNSGGEFKGAVAAFINIKQFISNYNAMNSPELYFWLFERNGEIVYYPESAVTAVTVDEQTMDSKMIQFMNLNAGVLPQGEYIAPGGQNTLVAASVVNGLGKDVLLIFATPEKQIKDLIKHFHTDHLLVTLCIVVLITGGGLFVLITIIRWNNALRREIVERKETEKQKEHLICELEQALSEIKVLSGFLPICASCKKIRDDKGYWNQIEVYISEHSKAQFSHGICPDCSNELYPEFFCQGSIKK